MANFSRKESSEDFGINHNSVRQYFNDINKIPLLDPKEERELEINLKKGDQEARLKLIKSNLRLVVSIAKRYKNCGLPLLDLIEEGNLGLIKACEKFKLNKGCKFSTYATLWIKQSIIRAIENCGRTIRIPVYMIKRINLFFKTVRELEQELHRNPTAEEISRKMKLKLDNVKKIMDVNFSTQNPTSIESYIGKEKYIRFIEFISNEHSIYKNTIAVLEQHQEISNLLDLLSSKEKDILILRFGLNGEEPLTLEGIGLRFNLTRERIRQIEDKAVKKLRNLVFTKEAEFLLKDTASKILNEK
ncbi:sigma-70 family RNA polymerase sigma factor [Candidatus Poribacteria bacterium]|nr:sigma-70 family RNA polymerase sigma factor [Candidatus Poribacteria bacterium]